MKNHRNYTILFFLLLAVWLAPTSVFAQTAATITGTVADSTGAVVPGAQITITNAGTGQSRTLQTNNVGRYYAPVLNPGSYQVEASSAGFQAVVHSGITLTVGAEIAINFTLNPGQVSERVEVTGEAPLV